MTYSDEQIMAYADGEVDAALRAQIDAALATDPQLAAKVAQHQALRRRLHTELDAVLSEPVPVHLLAALRAPATPALKIGNVVELKARTANKTTVARSRWHLREWGAMAATLVLAVGLGVFVLSDNKQNILTLSDGTLVAQGQLATALTEQLASAQRGSESVQIGLSFNSRAGDYCRTFSLPTLAGLACHHGDAWHVQALTAIKSDSADPANYRQAGSAMPAMIAALVSEELVAEPLDADGEAAARQARWRR